MKAAWPSHAVAPVMQWPQSKPVTVCPREVTAVTQLPRSAHTSLGSGCTVMGGVLTLSLWVSIYLPFGYTCFFLLFGTSCSALHWCWLWRVVWNRGRGSLLSLGWPRVVDLEMVQRGVAIQVDLSVCPEGYLVELFLKQFDAWLL